MYKSVFVLCVLILCVASFLGGRFFYSYQLFSGKRFVLLEDIELQTGERGEKRGVLPADTVIYRYRVLPEITTYVILVNIKEHNVMRPISRPGLSPVSGYPIDK